jgi:hypothetical protein
MSRADSVREQIPSRAQTTGGLRLCQLLASRARAEREHQASIERALAVKEDGFKLFLLTDGETDHDDVFWAVLFGL